MKKDLSLVIFLLRDKQINVILSKLAFLGFSNVKPDFHNSAPEYVGSFVAYDNELISPEQDIHRDKGFTLDYESEFKSCEFLIEG